jgi:hypothetical protein
MASPNAASFNLRDIGHRSDILCHSTANESDGPLNRKISETDQMSISVTKDEERASSDLAVFHSGYRKERDGLYWESLPQ